MAARGKKTTARQYELMIDFMQNHKDLFQGKLNSKFSSQDRDRLWEELTELLNSDGLGPVKPSSKWKKTWADIKSEAKGKAAEFRKYQGKTGGGPPPEKLPVLYEKINNLIDPVLITGDEEIVETGRTQECNLTNSHHTTILTTSQPSSPPDTSNLGATDVPLVLDSYENSEVKVWTRNSQKSPHRKITAKGYNKLLEIEAAKVNALKALVEEKKQTNELKKRDLDLYEQRTQLFCNIANEFFTNIK